MQKAYARINWQNSPSTATPLGESKLLPMDASIDEIDNRVVTFDTTKANQSDLLGCLSNVTYNETTGVFVFTWKNGNTLTADLNIEKIPVNFSMSAAGVITMTTSDGSTYTADVGDLIKTYTFQDSSEIDFTTTTDASGNKTITASLVDGSISGSKLYPNYLADCQAAVSNSSANATLAQSWAVGGTNTRTGEDTNNAEYWCRMAEQASGDGHTIIDPDGTAMTNETGLQFTGSVEVTDDPTNMRTVVNLTGVADNPTFTEASTRTNIASGESFSTILGKIKKFFTDLKTIAFSGNSADASYDNTTSGLTASDAKAAIDEVAKGVFSSTALASGTDLNTITKSGVYYSASDAITQSLVNCPVSQYGFEMHVMNWASTNGAQLILAYNKAYFRRGVSDAWTEISQLPLKISVPFFSTLPVTVSNSAITSDMEVTHFTLGSNVWIDATCTTANGSLTISGSVGGATTLTLYLEVPRA